MSTELSIRRSGMDGDSSPRSGTDKTPGLVRSELRRPLSFTEAALAWIGSYSALWLFTFWLLVLRARARTGEWPSPGRGPYQPSTIDPKEFPLHRISVYGGSLLLAMVVPISIGLLLTSLFVPSQRPRRRLCLALLMVTALVGTSYFSDFMLWFVD